MRETGEGEEEMESVASRRTSSECKYSRVECSYFSNWIPKI